MRLRQLEHFEALYRLRSFTRAAADQQVTQSALSRSIGALESELGERLFDRTTHSVEPTASADALIAHALDALTAARAMADAASLLSGGGHGSLRIGTGPYPSQPLLSNVVRRLSTTHPNLQVALVGGPASHLHAALVRRELDLVVCDISKLEESPFLDDIEVRPLEPEPLVFVAGAENPITAGTPAPAQIASCPWVLPPPAPLGRRYLPDIFTGIRRLQFPFYEMETTVACLDVVLDQRSITLVPLSLARLECPVRGLRYRIAGRGQRTHDGVHLLRGRTPSAAARNAVEAIESAAAEAAAAGKPVVDDRPWRWLGPDGPTRSR